MKKLIVPAVMLLSFTACGGDKTENEKKTSLCDCIEDGGKVVATKECQDIARKANVEEFEACYNTGSEAENNEDESTATASPATEAFLAKFKDLSFPYSLQYDEKNYSVSPMGGTSLKSDEQEKFLNSGGYDKDDNGIHNTAIGKIKISDRTYLLVYTEIMVPMPAVYDETRLVVFDVQNGVGKAMDLAYVRGGAGMGSELMTAKIKRDGDNIVVEQKLVVSEEIQTDEGIEEGPETTYKIVTRIDKLGNLKEGKKETVSVVKP